MSNTENENKELTRANIHEKAIEEHLDKIKQEFRQGFELLQKYPRSVSIFGSSTMSPESTYYKHAYEIAKKITNDLKYTIVNGGGPGIMEASSRGAIEAGGKSLGLRINLLRERSANKYSTDSINFTYFFARKTMLIFAAEAYVFMPGGFGTFDELFSVLTLLQTNKIPRVPVILFGSGFWNPLKDYMKRCMVDENKTISELDFDIFEITDSYDRVVDIVRKAPTSEWWKNIN